MTEKDSQEAEKGAGSMRLDDRESRAESGLTERNKEKRKHGQKSMEK